jgi:UDP-3-O-[3-hydroxymyristoyl] N-acetylglucosamine deacetylase
VEVAGTGFLTGATIHLRVLPAPAGTGIVFLRTDRKPACPIPARVDQVTGTQRRTTIGRPPNHVALVEHVIGALAGMRIDNCVVQLNGPEAPGLDGSSGPLVKALAAVGTEVQPARRPCYTVESPVKLAQHGATLAFYPGAGDLQISYFLDYGPQSPIPRQMHTERITPEGFCNQIANCRTFLLEEEGIELRRQGLGARVTAADLLIFGSNGPIDNKLRYANEPARHKILDLVGDLALFGYDLSGHVVAYRSGHPLNVMLARTLTWKLGAAPIGYRLAA